MTPPSGTITLLFTDIEASTERWERWPASMSVAMERHDEAVRSALLNHGGYVFKSLGDGFCAAFDRPRDALEASVAIQRAIRRDEMWDELESGFQPFKVRVGVHTGDAEYVGGDYRGAELARTARLTGAARGGQTLLSLATQQITRDSLPPGASCRDKGVHWLKDLLHSEHIFELVTADLPGDRRPLDTARELTDRTWVVVEGDASGERAADLSELLSAIRESPGAVAVTEELARHGRRLRPKNMTDYFLSRVLTWAGPRHRLDGRFVALKLLVDRGEGHSTGRWQEEPETHNDLADVLAIDTCPALVLLGPPGAGKSTLLGKLEFDTAMAALQGESEAEGRVTYFVELNRYRAASGEPLAPLEWLGQMWRRAYPDLPPLEQFMDAGRVTLLLDGINEIPADTAKQRREAVLRWKEFLRDELQPRTGCAAVLTCRTMDYSAPLSSDALRVPQVYIEALEPRQVREFIKLYVPDRWREVWSAVSQGPELDVVRRPYFLRLLVDHVAEVGSMPRGSAGLLTGFVRRALLREMERDNPLFAPNGLVTRRDCVQVLQGQWRSRHELPEHGLLIPKLTDLAYLTQVAHLGDEPAVIAMGRTEVHDALDVDEAEPLIRAAEALGVVEEDYTSGSFRFFHQLVQEYFAARKIELDAVSEFVASAWKAEDITPSVRVLIDQLPAGESLPALNPTGWEETLKLAVAVSDTPAAYISRLMEADVAFAGRAAAQSDVMERLPEGLLRDLRTALQQRASHRRADLRARLAAARALGELGDPQLELRTGPEGQFIAPNMVPLTQTDGWLGSNTGFADVSPEHKIAVEKFSLSARPVTNAEWSLFVQGGGYEDRRWWRTSAARKWRDGVGTDEGERQDLVNRLVLFRDDPTLLDEYERSGTLSEAAADLWRRRIEMSPEQLDQHLAELFPGGRRTAPYHWNESRYTQPTQPVVGISWFEAQAYCAWLAAQTGINYRLPTEAEWEVASRGVEGRVYAYGSEFDPLRGNTVETHLLVPTPVGLFVEGATPEGVFDLCGNVFEWTSSAYADEGGRLYAYPYDSTDGREELDTSPMVQRVTRGGAFCYDRRYAQATTRLGLVPGRRTRADGMRLAYSE